VSDFVHIGFVWDNLELCGDWWGRCYARCLYPLYLIKCRWLFFFLLDLYFWKQAQQNMPICNKKLWW
jgi:hypothetical protein